MSDLALRVAAGLAVAGAVVFIAIGGANHPPAAVNDSAGPHLTAAGAQPTQVHGRGRCYGRQGVGDQTSAAVLASAGADPGRQPYRCATVKLWKAEKGDLYFEPHYVAEGGVYGRQGVGAGAVWPQGFAVGTGTQVNFKFAGAYE